MRCPAQAAHISIHPPLAGRDPHQDRQADKPHISIHPPLAGRDVSPDCYFIVRLISIHPPLAGRDHCRSSSVCCWCYFNPPAPCGAGQMANVKLRDGAFISIHPPLAGRDLLHRFLDRSPALFQSTRPLRGGTPRQPEGGPVAYRHFNPPAPCGAGQQKFTKIGCKLLHL